MKVMFSFILILLLSFVLGQWLSDKEKIENQQSIYYSNCDPTKQSCEYRDENGFYLLEFSGVPSALVPFDVTITTNELNPKTIELMFEMSGMNMGYNIHYLVKNNDNWSSRVILPVCSLGRNDWVLNVKMEFEKLTRITAFKFSHSNRN